MNDNLDSLLNLLKEASFSQNLDQINTIQENLQKITHLIKADIENDNLNIEDEKIIEKINSVKDFIDSLEKKNKTKLKIFSEFNSFIENRKIK